MIASRGRPCTSCCSGRCPANDRFGLGPFFRIEPLGLEYIAAALESRGHRTTVADLRYSRSLDRLLRTTRPALVGIACMHALETDEVLTLADHVRRLSPNAFMLVGGHSAAAYPVAVLHAQRRRDLHAATASWSFRRWPTRLHAAASSSEVPGLLLPTADGASSRPTAADADRSRSTTCRCRLRRDVDAWRDSYACLLFRPVWLIETARGCPFRCSFCSVWPLHDRAVRLRSIESVCDDFEATGPARVRRGRSVLVSAGAQPRAGRGAEAARHPKALDPRAEPHRSRRSPSRSCSRRGVRSRRTSTSSSGSKRRPTKGSPSLVKDTTVDRTVGGVDALARASATA